MSGGTAIVLLVLLGIVAGSLGGMFGIGGGLLIVPTLALVFRLDQKTATGTSLFVILLPTGILGVLEFWRRGQVRFDYGLWVALGVLLGAFIGAKVVGPMPDRDMKRLYGAFLLILGLYYLYLARGQTQAEEPPRPATESAQDH
jgi:uncharacterized membrane protein YfcA